MAKLKYYLNFPGTTEEAFEFYRSVLGGELINKQRFNEVPGTENITGDAAEKIMHIAMVLPDGSTLMATDTLESMGQEFIPGNNYSLSLDCDSKAECEKIFSGLSAGGTVTMELQDTFWGAYFGMWTDKYGIQWMVNYDKN